MRLRRKPPRLPRDLRRVQAALAKVGREVKDDAYRGKLRLLVATRGPSGGNSPVRQVEVPISIPLSQGDATMSQFFVYEVKLQLPAGGNQVAGHAVQVDLLSLGHGEPGRA